VARLSYKTRTIVLFTTCCVACLHSQVSHPLAAPYNVTVNPLFQQISHGYKPAAVAPHHPAYPLGQGNNVSFTVEADRHGMAWLQAPCTLLEPNSFLQGSF